MLFFNNKIYLLCFVLLLLSCKQAERDSQHNQQINNLKQLPSPSSSVGGGKGNDINNYKTVVIGTQTWMAENLDYAVEGSRCYGNKSANCDKYGRLYDWPTAMGLPSRCNSSICSSQIKSLHRGICPEGWHLPSQTEWNMLPSHIHASNSCSDCGAAKLKAVSGWSSCGPPGSGNSYLCEDAYGFSALPGGSGYSDGSFDFAGNYGGWWSASEDNSYHAHYRDMYYYRENIFFSSNLKSGLFSVRCLQDK